MHRQERPHERPAENRDRNHDLAPNRHQDQSLARVHHPGHGLARALCRIRRLDHDRDLVVLSPEIRPDRDPSLRQDRARHLPPNHRHRDLDRAPSPGRSHVRSRDRDPLAVVAAAAVARAAKAAPRASESRHNSLVVRFSQHRRSHWFRYFDEYLYTSLSFGSIMSKIIGIVNSNTLLRKFLDILSNVYKYMYIITTKCTSPQR